MKKSLELIGIFIIMLILITVFASCLTTTINYTLTFKVDGVTYHTLSTDGSSAITIPEDPEKDGYDFGGWFWDDGTFNVALTANSLLDAPISSNMTVYARWVPEGEAPEVITYTVTFNTNGGTEIASLTIQAGATISLPSSPTKTGYTFDGWYLDSECNTSVESLLSGTISQNTTLYAKWTLKDTDTFYTITFYSKGGTDVVPINAKSGAEIVAPTEPTKIGYLFVGWCPDYETLATPYVFSTMPERNFALYAKWVEDTRPKTYTINFDSNGGSDVSPKSGEAGAKLIQPTDPEKEGYTFGGWCTDKGIFLIEYEFSIIPAEDITLYAKWDLVSYTLTYDFDGGDAANPSLYTIESADITLVNPAKGGYTFAGWSGTDIAGSSMAVAITAGSTGDRSYTASWTANDYTVTLDVNGGNALEDDTEEVTYDAVYTLVVPNRTGYTFGGWYSDAACIDNQYTNEDGLCLNNWKGLINIILFAKWTINQYTITFESNEGSDVAAITQDYGTTVTAPTDPTKEGYTFGGWYTDNDTFAEEYEFTTMSAEDITLYAKWTINQYTITFDSNDGSAVSAITQDYGTNVIAPTEPTKVGYMFDNWYTDNDFFNIYEFTTMPAEDIMLYARWDLVSYTLTYDFDGGDAANPSLYTIESADITLVNPAKGGYTFAGWSGTDIAGSSMAVAITAGSTGDRSYTASWTANDYTVTLDVNGGNALEDDTEEVTYDAVYTLVVPNRTGYTFGGWYSDAACIDNQYTNEDGLCLNNWNGLINIILFAKWTINQYTITFESNEGSDVAAITQDYGTTVTAPTDPTKEGYTFGGWYTDNDTFAEEYEFTTMSAEDITLYAKWTINQYTITFDSNDGSAVSAITQDYGTNVIAPTEPTKVGYMFDNWYTDNDFFNIYEFTTMPAEDIMLYARWDLVSYTLTYDFDGGDAANPSSYTIESADIILVDPAKDGYTFAGWSGTDITGSSMAVAITAGSTGDRSYTASWTANDYTVTLDVNGGNALEDDTEEVTYDAVYTLVVPNRTGYTFGGWYSDAACIDNQYTNEDGLCLNNWNGLTNITLFAKWTINQYAIAFDSNDGSVVSAITQDYGTTVTAPTDPTKEGYTFGGWYTDNDTFAEEYEFTTMPAKDIMLYAKWTINQYTITFDSNEGSEVANIVQNYNTAVNAPDEPIREGYTFMNWYTDDGIFLNIYSFSTMPASDITLYADWAVYDGTVGLGFTLINDDTEYSVNKGILTDIAEVTIPASYRNLPVTTIKADAFKDYFAMTSMTIPDSVMSIGSSAFSGCSNLLSMILPFVGSSKIATVASSNTLFGYIFGTSSYTGGTSTQQYYASSSSTTYYIPTSLRTVTITGGNILYGAFYNCSVLTSVTIGDSVTSIGYRAFSGCSGLTKITLPFVGNTNDSTSNTHFGYIFGASSYLSNSSCVPSSITTVIITGGTSIGSSALYGCSGLTSITIPDSVMSIGDAAFYGCSGLTSVTIPDSVTSIGDWAFHDCSGLTSITIPDGVTSIGNYAFYDCSGLTSVTLGSGVTSIGGSAFEDCSKLTSITIPDNVTIIGNSAFYGCSGLTSVTIPDNVTYICNYAFYNCSGLTSVTLGSGVTSIGGGAFEYCYKLIEIYNRSSLSITAESSDNGCIAYYVQNIYTPSSGSSKLSTNEDGYIIYTNNSDKLLMGYIGSSTELVIPEDITAIHQGAFYLCEWLTSITMPDSVTNIGDRAFYNCSGLTSIAVDSGNTRYKSIDGVLFNYAGTRLICYPAGKTSTSYSIPDDVTSIDNSAFYHCYRLTSITIPDSVTSIGYSAFYGCSGLTSVYVNATLPPTLGSDALYYNASSRIIYVPAASVDAYKAANGWSSYASYIYADETLYTITFDSKDGSDVASISARISDSVSAPVDPTMTGYSFVGWYIDNNTFAEEYEFTTMPAKNFTLYAKWIVNQYTITFNSNNGSDVDSIKQDYDSAVSSLTDPTKAGYTFDSWYTDDGTFTIIYEFSTMPAENITLYAKWDLVSYTITYDLDGGDAVNPSLYTIESADITLVNPTAKDGYTFAGWSGTDIAGSSTNVTIAAGSTGDRSYTASWTANDYTVTLNVNGGNALEDDTEEVTYDAVYTLVVPNKTGYSFAGWYSDSACIDNQYTNEDGLCLNNWNGLTNIILFAKWTINQYTITFNSNNGSDVEAITQDYDSAVSAPTDPTKAGYTFDGWYTDDGTFTVIYEFTTMPAENITLYAKWDLVSYTLTYELDGGDAANPSLYTIESADIILVNPAKDGYTFAGWSGTDITGSSTAVTIAAGSTGDRSYTASWTANDYTVTLDVNGGNALEDDTEEVTYGEEYTLSAASKEGNTFNGWYTATSGGTSVPLTGTWNIDADTTLYAVWSVNSYDLTLENANASAGTVSGGGNKTYGSGVIAAVTANAGYSFSGWYEGEMQLSAEASYSFTMPARDLTIEARWSLIEYSITYHLGDGSNSVSNPSVYTVESVVELADATLEGKVFAGWYLESDYINQIETITGLTGNLNIYAEFVNEKVTITLNDVGSLAFEDICEDTGTAISAPEVAEADQLAGYELHWYTDSAYESEYTFSIMPESDSELWGRWLYIAVDEGFFPYYTEFTSLSISIANAEELQAYIEFVCFFDLALAELTDAQKAVGITYVSGAENINAEISSKYALCTYAKTGAFSYGSTSSTFKVYISSSLRSIEATVTAAEEDAYAQIGNILYDPQESERDIGFDIFKINEVTMTASVTTSNQLLYVLEHGYKPVPVEGSSAETIYTEAKTVLRSVISDAMTDYEKAEAIYEWLVMNVAYDYDAVDGELDWQYYDAYYLEGVFNNGRAVCDGIAKAFSVLCRIEGIPAVRVTGTGNGGGHAWNKVMLNGEWYILDATWGGGKVLLSSTYYEYLDYQDFLLTDTEKAGMNCDDTTYIQLIADTEYDFYGGKDLEISAYSFDLVIDSTEELSYLLQFYLAYYSEYGGLYVYITVEFVINYDVGDSFNDEYSAAVGLLTTRGYSWAHSALRSGNITIGSVNTLFLS